MRNRHGHKNVVETTKVKKKWWKLKSSDPVYYISLGVYLGLLPSCLGFAAFQKDNLLELRSTNWFLIFSVQTRNTELTNCGKKLTNSILVALDRVFLKKLLFLANPTLAPAWWNSPIFSHCRKVQYVFYTLWKFEVNRFNVVLVILLKSRQASKRTKKAQRISNQRDILFILTLYESYSMTYTFMVRYQTKPNRKKICRADPCVRQSKILRFSYWKFTFVG